MSYRPLVFEFVEGNNDKLYFPSYSFMEWLPNGSGVKLSFLITKMKPKPEPVVKVPSTPIPKAVQTPTPTPVPTLAPTSVSTPVSAPVPAPGAQINSTLGAPQSNAAPATPNPHTPAAVPLQPAAPPTPAPYVAPPRIEDFDEKNDIEDIEFYQPVTVLLLSEHPDIVHSLPRAVRPPDVVTRYMEEVFDKCKRAEETYLAFRLPKDNEAETAEKKVRSGDVTPAVATPVPDVAVSGSGMGMSALMAKKSAGRPRRSMV